MLWLVDSGWCYRTVISWWNGWLIWRRRLRGLLNHIRTSACGWQRTPPRDFPLASSRNLWRYASMVGHSKGAWMLLFSPGVRFQVARNKPTLILPLSFMATRECFTWPSVWRIMGLSGRTAWKLSLLCFRILFPGFPFQVHVLESFHIWKRSASVGVELGCHVRGTDNMIDCITACNYSTPKACITTRLIGLFFNLFTVTSFFLPKVLRVTLILSSYHHMLE